MHSDKMAAGALLAAAREVSGLCGAMRFAPPVTHVYNPLEYAWDAHRAYIERYGTGSKKVVFLGMNPGPWGMVQVGVPFGEVEAVRDWLKLDTPVGKPSREHPKRPVLGFACTRSEVSGRRFWALMAERFGTPEKFFEHHYVANYCPLSFMEVSGLNRTPDKLPAVERAPLIAACDRHLKAVAEALSPRIVIGIGNYATRQAERALEGMGISFGTILHPSPASPAANRGWAEAVTRQLEEAGIWRARRRSGPVIA